MNNEKNKTSQKGSSATNSMISQKSIVMPAVSSDEAVKAWQEYEDLKKKIAQPEDTQLIEGKPFLKKSYWRKIATFFNLTVKVINEKSEKIDSTFAWHFTCEAIAPNGRSVIGVGSCDAYEKATFKDGQYLTYNRRNKTWYPAKPNSIHNIRATAETRAFNRAVSNLVGGGEVSAEEVNGSEVNIEEAKKIFSNGCTCGTKGKYHSPECPLFKKAGQEKAKS